MFIYLTFGSKISFVLIKYKKSYQILPAPISSTIKNQILKINKLGNEILSTSISQRELNFSVISEMRLRSDFELPPLHSVAIKWNVSTIKAASEHYKWSFTMIWRLWRFFNNNLFGYQEFVESAEIKRKLNFADIASWFNVRCEKLCITLPFAKYAKLIYLLDKVELGIDCKLINLLMIFNHV